MTKSNLPGWRGQVAGFVDSPRIHNFVIGVIIFNAIILGLETSLDLMASHGGFLKALDKICLVIFVVELLLRMAAHRFAFFKDGWNVFDFAVIAVAFVPGAGAWSVLRSLRVLRVLRLLTAIPSLKKVVAALLHAIPGLLGVITVMTIFFYTAAVLATQLFGSTHPQWFGDLGSSLYTLFQIMTLESWSMGIVRPVMESHPWAWAFFVPFIILATFTILNLFLGIIVSTMQELSMLPDPNVEQPELIDLLTKIEDDLRKLRALATKK
ncbi:MAG: voltage-gated sodium channel [Paracoccaceae bacterium]|jgi:voltage-gated sodium channel